MNLLSTGDLARSIQMRRFVADTKADIDRQSAEVATGLTADPGKRLAGDYTPLAGIDRSLAMLDSYKVATDEAATFATALQAVLERVQTLGEDTGNALMTAASSGQDSRLAALSAQSRQAFDTAVSALNTRVAGRALLAGTATDGAATISAGTMLDELRDLTTGMTAAADIATAVQDWFDGTTTGFGTVAYLGSGTGPAAFSIGDGVTLATDLTAAAPELRDMLRGLALGALLSDSGLSLPADQAAGLARAAGEGLLTANGAFADLRARIGTVEGRIEEIAVQNSAESDMLQTARLSILAVDPYEAATALKDSETRLQTLYALTARLSGLSLTEYLR